jgi:hypothetical protein
MTTLRRKMRKIRQKCELDEQVVVDGITFSFQKVNRGTLPNVSKMYPDFTAIIHGSDDICEHVHLDVTNCVHIINTDQGPIPVSHVIYGNSWFILFKNSYNYWFPRIRRIRGLQFGVKWGRYELRTI